jgi:hypothetical protein
MRGPSAIGTRKQQIRNVLTIAGLISLSLITVILFLSSKPEPETSTTHLPQLPYMNPPIKPRPQPLPPINVPIPTFAQGISYFDEISGPELDLVWFEILLNSPIVAVEELTKGLSLRFVVALLGADQQIYRAAMKPCLDPYEIANGTTWEYLDYFSMKNPYAVRTGRSRGQGVGEILGFRLDRALKLYRKPPIIGRYVSNKVLYTYDDSEDAKLHREMEEYFIPVAMIAWVDTIRFRAPPDSVAYSLKQHFPIPDEGTPEYIQLSTVSDTILFDFIIDGWFFLFA